MKRVTATVLLITALISTAVRLPASVCIISSAPIGKACRMACCANESCCTQSEKNQNLPATPLAQDSGVASHELVAIPVATLKSLVASAQSLELSFQLPADVVACSAPDPAFLCTFLI